MYDDTGFEAMGILSQFKSIDTLTEKLNFILVLLYSIEGDKQKLFENEIKMFEDIMSNVMFMRQVKHRDSLVKDYPTEYFGRDYGEGDPFLFKKKLENEINDIELQMMGVLGRVIKIMSSSQVVIGDET